MSFQRESADISPDYDDNFEVDLNAFEIGAAVTMAGIGVASVGITTAAAPTVVGVPSLFAGGLALKGFFDRHGHLPFMGKDQAAPATPAPVAAPQPVAVASPPPITDRAGQEVNPEYI